MSGEVSESLTVIYDRLVAEQAGAGIEPMAATSSDDSVGVEDVQKMKDLSQVQVDRLRYTARNILGTLALWEESDRPASK